MTAEQIKEMQELVRLVLLKIERVERSLDVVRKKLQLIKKIRF
ncbi:MAG TPA: hypothetical protein VJ112_04995 [Rhabdochlamydiaceae bacterium]|nr:hypothetical protein [Rhabdochlamydiaceae bacterium]